MSFERELQPGKDDYNSEFAREYIRRSHKEQDIEAPPSDSDASFSGLARELLERALSEAPVTSAAIRTELPWHGAFPALVFRHTIEFTLVFTICFGVYFHDPRLLLKLAGWCILNALVFGAANSVSQRDRDLSHASFPGLWWIVPVATFLPIASGYPLVGQVILGSLLLLFIPIAFFPGFTDVPGAMLKCGLFALITGLAFALGPLEAVNSQSRLTLLLLLFTANCLLILPFGMNMQHWFAAHRYASIHDVRCYGRLAERRYQPTSLILRGVFAQLVIFPTGFVLALLHGVAMLGVLERFHAAQDQYIPLVLIGLCGTLGVGIYLFVLHMVIARRWPRPDKYLQSYYVTWRCLAAWLSDDPGAAGPTSFRFSSPWTSVTARRTLFGVSLGIHSALAVWLLRTWTMQLLDEAELLGIEHPLWNATYLSTVILGAVVWPPVMLFLTVHATWGGTLETFSQRFELFDERVHPPIINRAVRA